MGREDRLNAQESFKVNPETQFSSRPTPQAKASTFNAHT